MCCRGVTVLLRDGGGRVILLMLFNSERYEPRKDTANGMYDGIAG